MPLESHLPFFILPWIFTYNDWSKGESGYDDMVKAAVRSAITVGGVKPYCLFSGDVQSDMYGWLAGKGVKMIQVCGDGKVQGCRHHEITE